VRHESSKSQSQFIPPDGEPSALSVFSAGFTKENAFGIKIPGGRSRWGSGEEWRDSLTCVIICVEGRGKSRGQAVPYSSYSEEDARIVRLCYDYLRIPRTAEFVGVPPSVALSLSPSAATGELFLMPYFEFLCRENATVLVFSWSGCTGTNAKTHFLRPQMTT
jgi:hypothetical protein